MQAFAIQITAPYVGKQDVAVRQRGVSLESKLRVAWVERLQPPEIPLKVGYFVLASVFPDDESWALSLSARAASRASTLFFSSSL